MTANPKIITGPHPLVWHRVLFRNSSYAQYLNVATWADQQPQNQPVTSTEIVHEHSNATIVKTSLPMITSDLVDNGSSGLGKRHLHYLLGPYWRNIEQVTKAKERARPLDDPSSSSTPHYESNNSEFVYLTKTIPETLRTSSTQLPLQADAISEHTLPKTNGDIMETSYNLLTQPADSKPRYISLENSTTETSSLPPLQSVYITSDCASLETGVENVSSTTSPQQTNNNFAPFNTSADTSSGGPGPKSRFGIHFTKNDEILIREGPSTNKLRKGN